MTLAERPYPAEPLASRKAPLTELERIEVAADLRDQQAARALKVQEPALPGNEWRRQEWLDECDRSIARLERLLAE